VKNFTLFNLLFWLLISTAFPWGGTGHTIIVQIAEQELTPQTKEEIAKILGKHSLSEYARWADEVKREERIFEHTRFWHYSNLGGKNYFTVATPQEGDAVQAFVKMYEILSTPQSTPYEKEMALKFIIHITGDLHNPFHLGDASDRGGNDVRLIWNNKKTNLHSVWDSLIIEQEHPNWKTYGEELYQGLKNSQRQKYVNSSVLNWINETNAVFSQNNKAPYLFHQVNSLAKDYSSLYAKDIDNLLLKSGIRLGSLLNQFFDPQSVSSQLIEKRNEAHLRLKSYWGKTPLKAIRLPEAKTHCNSLLLSP